MKTDNLTLDEAAVLLGMAEDVYGDGTAPRTEEVIIWLMPSVMVEMIQNFDQEKANKYKDVIQGWLDGCGERAESALEGLAQKGFINQQKD